MRRRCLRAFVLSSGGHAELGELSDSADRFCLGETQFSDRSDRMSEYSARPKVADGVILAGSVCMIGAQDVVPQLGHLFGQFLFWSGLAGVVLYPAWRWGWHYLEQGTLAIWRRKISLEDAAQIAYESVERMGIDPMTRYNFSSPTVPLSSMKFMLMYQCDDVELFGVRPPSTASLPIPRSEWWKRLHPADKGSALLPIDVNASPTYVDVKISRRDLKRSIAHYVADLRRAHQLGAART